MKDDHTLHIEKLLVLRMETGGQSYRYIEHKLVLAADNACNEECVHDLFSREAQEEKADPTTKHEEYVYWY